MKLPIRRAYALRWRSLLSRRPWLRTVCCLCLILAPVDRLWAEDRAAAVRPDELEKFEESWHVVYIASSRVGYERSATGRVKRDGRDVVVSDTEMAMALSRFGQKVKTRTLIHTEETPGGDLLGFDYEMLNPPAAPTRAKGRVVGDKLLLSTETDGQSKSRELAWDQSIKSPAYQDRLLRENPLKPGETRTFKSFDPQFAKTATITLKAGEFRETKLLDGQSRRLLEVTVTQSLIPQIAVMEYLDEEGTQLKSAINLMSMTTYTVSKEQALETLSGDEVDLAVTTLIKTNPIDRASETRQVTYRITIPGDDPEKTLPAGPTQKIAPIGPNVVDLTVTAISPPAAQADSSAAPGKEYLTSNTYVQLDDRLVKQHAADAAGTEADPWKAAQAMERWVSQNLKKKNFSTLLASAAEVARDLSGDCTEHAVLLVAMCRARGIPARVAVGLVYVPKLSSFAGHMWTEVFVRGVWIPLDATLGNGGISADHIKFADSSFSDDGDIPPVGCFVPMVGALGKMKIEVRDVKYAK